MRNRAAGPRPRLRLASIAAISAVCVFAFAGSAHAQSAEAEALFNDGDALMKQGKLAEACDAFEGSNKLEPRAGTMIRLGECREKNGQLASAWSAYKDALTRVKDEKKKKIATAKVAELEPKLSYLTVSVPDRVDGLEITRNGQPLDPVLWNRSIPVNGGDYTIVARALDHKEWKGTINVPLEKGKVKLDVPRLSKATQDTLPADRTPKRPPDNERDGQREEPTDEPTDETPVETPAPSSFTGKRKLAVALGVLGVGAGVAAAIFATTSRNEEAAAFELCPDPTYPCANGNEANSKIDSAKSYATLTNISIGVGGACLVTAVVLFIIGGPDTPAQTQTSVRPLLQGGTTGLAIGGRF